MAEEGWMIKEDQLNLKDDQLGEGGYGAVYLAELQTLNGVEIVAAKKISIKSLDAESQNKELSVLQRMNSSHVINFKGALKTQDEKYLIIVTELAEKGSLHDYLSKERASVLAAQIVDPDLQGQSEILPDRLFFRWAIQASLAVRYIQRQGVVHRDIKSPNFVITKDNDLKLCDFGIAKETIRTKSTESEGGTTRWMAPENYKGAKAQVSPKSDIFSLALVIWELIKGEKPFEGSEDFNVMWKVGHEGIRPAIPDRVSPPIRDLLTRCWCEDRSKRPTIDEVIDVLYEEWLRRGGKYMKVPTVDS